MSYSLFRGLFFPAAVLSALVIFGPAQAQTTTQPGKPVVVTPPPAKVDPAPALKAAPATKSDASAPKAATTTVPPKAATAAPKAATASPSECKGLEEKPCRLNADGCYWIAATKRKDGTDVKAFCRSKPMAAAKSAAPETAKATATPPPAKSVAKPVEKAAAPAATTPPPAPKPSAEKTK